MEDEGDVMHDLAAAHTARTADAVYELDASMLRACPHEHCFRFVQFPIGGISSGA